MGTHAQVWWRSKDWGTKVKVDTPLSDNVIRSRKQNYANMKMLEVTKGTH